LRRKRFRSLMCDEGGGGGGEEEEEEEEEGGGGNIDLTYRIKICF